MYTVTYMLCTYVGTHDPSGKLLCNVSIIINLNHASKGSMGNIQSALVGRGYHWYFPYILPTGVHDCNSSTSQVFNWQNQSFSNVNDSTMIVPPSFGVNNKFPIAYMKIKDVM